MIREIYSSKNKSLKWNVCVEGNEDSQLGITYDSAAWNQTEEFKLMHFSYIPLYKHFQVTSIFHIFNIIWCVHNFLLNITIIKKKRTRFSSTFNAIEKFYISELNRQQIHIVAPSCFITYCPLFLRWLSEKAISG